MKPRLDTLLVERGLAPTRNRAQALVLAGLVFVDGRRAERAGTRVSPDSSLEVRGAPHPYVSRGGVKLAHALAEFKVPVAGRVALDVGASTGGFTDCLLQHGARRVYAVDVGYGQLAWKLRQDPRVVCLERTNARYLQRSALGELAELVTADVSFISLRLVWPALAAVTVPGADVLSLVKPQFEAGRHRVGRRGVVRDGAVHREVLLSLLAAAPATGLEPVDLTFSPLLGPEGNIEFWLYLRAGGSATGADWPGRVETVVALAHRSLGVQEPDLQPPNP